MHCDAEVNPVVAAYVPSGHIEIVEGVDFIGSLVPVDSHLYPVGHVIQDVAPVLLLYVPTWQGVWLLGVGQYAPAAQGVSELEPDGQYVPSLHAVQLDAPARLYVPAGQFGGLPVLPVQKDPAVQGLQVLISVAAVAVLKVVAGQDLHCETFVPPGKSRYVPTGHAIKVLEPGGR